MSCHHDKIQLSFNYKVSYLEDTENPNDRSHAKGKLRTFEAGYMDDFKNLEPEQKSLVVI